MVTAAVMPSNAGCEDVATPDHRPSSLQAIACLKPSLNCFASVGHLNKLQRTWLNCIQAMRPNVPRMKSSTCVIYAQPRGELRKELIACLRMARAKRWPRSKGEDRRGHMANLLSIHVRPPEIEDRQFPGHWEGDLIKGAGNQSAVGTLVERNTRLLILVKLPHPHPATAAHVLRAFTDKLNAIAQPMRQTLTYDRGTEMAYHQQLSANTGIAVYFCDPHSPWQRGTNENTNGLIRQFLPKGTDLSGYSQEQLDAIADLMNGRPRKTLDWCTPHEVYSAWLAKLEDSSQTIQ